jgi:hypothetical protein
MLMEVKRVGDAQEMAGSSLRASFDDPYFRIVDDTPETGSLNAEQRQAMSHSQTQRGALLQSNAWDGLRFALGAYYRDGDHALLRRSVVPSVASSVLNHAVSRFEKNLSSVANSR